MHSSDPAESSEIVVEVAGHISENRLTPQMASLAVEMSFKTTPEDWVEQSKANYIRGRASFAIALSDTMEPGKTPEDNVDFIPTLKMTLLKMWVQEIVDEKDID